MSSPFIAQITGFGGNFAPRGWAFCEGQLLSISQNQALFSLVGTIYGGDGRTTFALPDLRGRSMVGPGQGPGLNSVRLGARGGAETVTLNSTQMPSHSHTATLHSEDADAVTSRPVNNMLAKSGADTIYAPFDAAANRAMSSESITVANSGGNQSFPIRDPYLAVYWIIALLGIYPSRN